MKIRFLLTVFLLFLFTGIIFSESFSVIDARNRKVEFLKPPVRIAAAGRAVIMLADALFLFPEALDRIIAMSNTDQGTGNFMKLLIPDFDENMIVLANNTGPEQIAATMPDLVILKSFMAEKLGKSLDTLKIPVVYLDFETPETYFRDLKIIGKIFQNEERAEYLAEYFYSILNLVNNKVSGINSIEKPSVLLLYYSISDGQYALNIPPAAWMQTILVEKSGGLPLWVDEHIGSGWVKVSFEQIAAWNPDFIFITSYHAELNNVMDQLNSNSTWKMLNAVKSGNLYGFPVDFYSWDLPDTRWILGLLWLSTKIHPDLFSDIDIEGEVLNFFTNLFNLSADAVYNRLIPKIQGDYP